MAARATAWREIVNRAPMAIIGHSRSVEKPEQPATQTQRSPRTTASASAKPIAPKASEVLTKLGPDEPASAMPARPWGNATARLSLWLATVLAIVAAILLVLTLTIIGSRSATVADVLTGVVGLLVALVSAWRAYTALRERGLSPTDGERSPAPTKAP